MSFAIIISEKGGAERRELFDKTEVVVGRLQGNDLMLQKSNVSKRHVRLLLQAGRFIVADLESTNGTYVNGRKILKPTIVREGDKIYVGDFVLRFEAGPGTVLAAESSPTAPGPREATAAELGQLGSVPSPAPREGISHYPLENDPDEGQNPKISIPAAPRLPSNLRGGTQAIPTQSPAVPGAAAVPPPGPSTDAGNPQIHALAHAIAAGGNGSTAPLAPPVAAPAPAIPPGPPRPASSSSPSLQPFGGPTTLKPTAPSASPRDSSAHAAHRLALAALLDALSERVSLAPLLSGVMPVEGALAQRIEQALRELIPQLRQEGDLPESIDSNLLFRDAQRELLGLGPLGPLLDDDDVASIQILRHDVLTVQRGSTQGASEPAFSSEEALRRAIARLCHLSGKPLDPTQTTLERRLPQAHLLAVLAPASQGTSAMIRRRRRADGFEDPVRSGIVARVAWNFLLQCLGARLNLLLITPPSHGGLLGALVASLPADEKTAALLQPEQPVALPPHATPFQLGASPTDELVDVVGRMGFDRLVLGTLAEGAGAALLEVMSERPVSVLAATHGSGARQTLARLVADLCASRPGLAPEVAREWLGASFDLIVEVHRVRDGRMRVQRIAEVTGVEAGAIVTRDLFIAVADRNGNGDSSLTSAGNVPRFLDDMRSRGFAVDPVIFERASSR